MKRVPIYVKIMDNIHKYISENNLIPGDRIPTEIELMKKYDVSRATVRKAVQELENEGIIEKKHGLGTFVAEVKMSIEFKGFFSFSEEVKKQCNGKEPKTKILSFKKIKLDRKKIIDKLELLNNEEVYYIERLRFIDNDPVMLEISYLPVRFFEGLKKDELVTGSIYTVMKNHGIKHINGKENHLAYMPNEFEQKKLELDVNVPVFRFSRVLTEDGIPIEYTISILKTGKVRLEYNINEELY